MAKKQDNNSRLNLIVGWIWIGVFVIGAFVLVILLQYSAKASSVAAVVTQSGEVSVDLLPATEAPTMIATLAPTEMPAADVFTSEDVIPTATPKPTTAIQIQIPLAPVALPTSAPDNDALYEGPIVIGYSVQGRPLEVYRFGRGENAYLVIGGIHGGYEINTIHLTEHLISYFTRKPDAVPTDATLYILRSLNPDGETMPYDKFGRANANNVDLNRSFPVGWQPDWDRNGCWDLIELSAGEYGGSEPEAAALMAFMEANPMIAVVSYHSAAPGFYPAGDPVDHNSDKLATYLSHATEGEYPYPSFETGCYMTGSLVDWALTTGAAGVDIELSNHYDSDFSINLNLVLALLRWQP